MNALIAVRQTIHGLYAFTRFVLFGARRPPAPRPAVLYDQDAEPSPLELAQVVAEATDIARQAAT